MDESLFSKVRSALLDKNIVPDELVDNFARCFSVRYGAGDIIVPNEMSKYLSISVLYVCHMLNVLVEAGLLTSVLVFDCPECGHIDKNVIYNAFWECPAWITCPVCGVKSDGLTETILVYKRI